MLKILSMLSMVTAIGFLFYMMSDIIARGEYSSTDMLATFVFFVFVSIIFNELAKINKKE